MKLKIISTKREVCPCCMGEHDIKIVQIKEDNIFKGEAVKYVAEYTYCDATDELYSTEEQLSQNDIRMKDAYRKKQGLYTSKDICSLRTKHEISQSDLCILLGWGGKTIARYETHQVQDKAHDSILKKLDQDPEWFIHLLIEAKPKIQEDAYKRYMAVASRFYEKNHDNYLRKAIYGMYAEFNGNEAYTGSTELSLDKVVDVICYFSDSDNVTGLYKVKLMKLLWYSDFLSYKIRNRSITGLIYRALPMGAVPIGHESIICLHGITCEEVEIGEGTGYRFFPSKHKQYPYLSDEERHILDIIIQKFGRMSKNEIVNYMHNEQAYKMTPPKEIIQYIYAKELSVEV